MFVSTRSSVLKRKSEDSCETVIFQEKRNERSESFDVKTAQAEPAKKKESMSDLKKLRYEVIKFGSSGLNGSKKDESRVALAVALGAVPPKRKHKNYKKILANKSAKKRKESGAIKLATTKRVHQKGISKWKKVAGNNIGGLLNSYGKVKPNKE